MIVIKTRVLYIDIILFHDSLIKLPPLQKNYSIRASYAETFKYFSRFSSVLISIPREL